MLRLSLIARRAVRALAVLAAGCVATSLCLTGAASAAERGTSDKPIGLHSKQALSLCSGGRANKIVPGDCLVVTADGFQPAEVVRARLLSNPDHRVTLVADGTGTARWLYIVAATAQGKDVATFVGQGAPHDGAASGNVVVTVPRIGILRYTVHEPSGQSER
jgi:hypothetical protein